MERDIKKKIDKAFYCYKQFVNGCVISTVDWAESGLTANYDKLPVQSSRGNGKETKLCQIIDDNAIKLKWCRVVENTLSRYHGDYREVLIRKRYFDRKSISELMAELAISRATMFRWLDEIRECAEMWAKEMRLI